MNSNCWKLLDLRNLQEQVEKAFCYKKLFWPFTVRINCFSDLKTFESSRPSASNFKSFSRSLEHFFQRVGQNNFGNKIPFLRLEKTPQKYIVEQSDWKTYSKKILHKPRINESKSPSKLWSVPSLVLILNFWKKFYVQ